MLYPWANGEPPQIIRQRIGRKLVGTAKSLLSRLYASRNEPEKKKIIVKI